MNVERDVISRRIDVETPVAIDVEPKAVKPANSVVRGRQQELEYVDPLMAAAEDDRSRSWLLSAVLLVGLLGVLGVWAVHAELEEISSGPARIIPSQGEQVIQSLEGGILSAMLVQQGAVVQAGDALLRIDPMRAQTAFQETRSRQLALLASAARLRAEASGASKVRFAPELLAESSLTESEQSTFDSRRTALKQAIKGLERSRSHLLNEIQLTEPLVRKGLASEVELLRLRRQLSDIDLQIEERANRAKADASTELVRVEAELAQQTEVLAGRRDLMNRTVIKAPLRGIVKNIKVNTVGGVIQPAQEIMELIPLEDKLLVEVKIRPADVAFLRVGLPASVKLSAYDSQIYGALPGVVDFISPDTLNEDRRGEESAYYRVLVKTSTASIHHMGKTLPVLPGMTATVDILTGHRTVANYFLKPVLRLREAFRER